MDVLLKNHEFYEGKAGAASAEPLNGEEKHKRSTGTCKLCLRNDELQDSHLIGRAVYNMCRDGAYAPVVMTPSLATHTSRQIRDYVFCRACEDRLNKGGERYVTGLICDGQSFPLLQRITLAPFAGKPVNSAGLMQYSSTKLGIDSSKLAYYAISLVWRAAVHVWRTLGQQTTSVELSSSRKEEFRRFLMGYTSLSHDVGVVMTVCTDVVSQGLVFTPTRLKTADFTRYAILVRGIYFRIIVDVPGRFPLTQVCLIHSPNNAIWVESCDEHTRHSFRSLKAYAKVATNLR